MPVDPRSFGKRLGTLERALSWSFGTDLAGKLAVLATTVIAVRALAPLSFGQFVGLSATAFLAAWIWDAGVASVVERGFAARRITLRGALHRALRLRLILLPVWLLAMITGALIIGRDHPVPVAVVVSFGAASFLFSTHALILALLRGDLRFASAGMAMASGRWFTAALSVLAVLPLGLHPAMLVLAVAMVAGELLTLALATIALARQPAFREDVNYKDAAVVTLKAALPFNLNGLLITAYNRLDVVILGALASAQQLGLYAPASRIQDALMLITSSLGVIAFPLISAASARGQSDVVQTLVRRLIAIGLAISIPVAVLMTVMAPVAIRMVLGSDYIGAVTATRILVWTLPFMAVSAPLLSALAGSGNASQTTKVFAAAFLTAIVLHLSLDWWWGATGGAVASFAREPVALLVLIVIVTRLGLLNRTDQMTNLKTGLAGVEVRQ